MPGSALFWGPAEAPAGGDGGSASWQLGKGKVTDFASERRELTSAQREIWFAQLLDPHGASLNIGLYAEILCDIDEAALPNRYGPTEALRGPRRGA